MQYGEAQVGPRLARILRIPGTGGRALAAYQLSRELFAPANRAMLMGRDFHDAYEAEDADLERRLANLDSFRQVSLLESELYMGNMLLRDTDVMAMANSIEVRVPMLDHVLVEQVWRFPTTVKSPSTQRKALLIGAMGQDIPAAVTSRPKAGFTLPWPEWIASGLRAQLGDTVADHNGLDGLIDKERVRRLGTEMLKSGDPRTWSRLWALHVADRWFRSTRSKWMAASTAT
jgi:asparagine synthase (glutamine-hydrolysing)